MYDKKPFGGFLTDVVNRADKKSIERKACSLSDRYNAPTTVIKMIGVVANAGWPTFSELARLLSCASYFDFAAELATFVVSHEGLIVVGALVYWGGKDSIKVLYNNRKMVCDVKVIGDKYEHRYNQCNSETEYETLVNEAAEELYNL